MLGRDPPTSRNAPSAGQSLRLCCLPPTWPVPAFRPFPSRPAPDRLLSTMSLLGTTGTFLSGVLQRTVATSHCVIASTFVKQSPRINDTLERSAPHPSSAGTRTPRSRTSTDVCGRLKRPGISHWGLQFTERSKEASISSCTDATLVPSVPAPRSAFPFLPRQLFFFLHQSQVSPLFPAGAPRASSHRTPFNGSGRGPAHPERLPSEAQAPRLRLHRAEAEGCYVVVWPEP